MWFRLVLVFTAISLAGLVWMLFTSSASAPPGQPAAVVAPR